jgi:iron complex outermembrane receptor protein
MRYLFFFLMLLAELCFAQKQDSIVLREVTVFGQSDLKYLSGSAIHKVDSVLKQLENASQLNDVLSLQFPIYFRNYGNGMISGISLRGTSPHHTAVLWNGININSFSLGQADFSILPSSAFDEVTLHEGGGSARFGSGAFGGTILLNSTTSIHPTGFSVSQQVGSFGRYFTSFRGIVQANRFTFKTKLYYQDLENDFEIKEAGRKQQDASINQKGILQDIHYFLSDEKSLSLNYWHHQSDREVQPTIGQLTSNNTQLDKNHRLNLGYTSRSNIGLLSVNGGYVQDVIVYNGDGSKISRWISRASYEFDFFKKGRWQVGGEWSHIKGKVRNYENGEAVEDRYDFIISLVNPFSERLSFSANLRQPIIQGFKAPLLPYVGAEYQVINDKFKVVGNVSKNYRAPTFNDRYWQNAGSRNLLPETSYAAEFGYQFNFRKFSIYHHGFIQQMEDYIQWIPDEQGNYRPRNVKEVNIKGTELKIGYQKQLSRVKISSHLSYQFVRSVTTKAPVTESYSIGKQLIYTPKHTASAYVNAAYKKYLFSLTLQYAGKRYTEFSNEDLYALEPYALVNIHVSKFWLVRSHRFDLSVAIKNITNIQYQMYSGLAMPGRNYTAQLTYQLNHKTK